MKHNIELLHDLSAYVTSVALMSGAVFPNLTMPHFDKFTSSVDGYGGFLATIYAPIVVEKNVFQWEEYTTQNKWWVNASNEIEVSDASSFIFDSVNGSKVPSLPNEENEYAPIWHLTPPLDLTVVNDNLFSDPDVVRMYSIMKETDQVVIASISKGAGIFEDLFDEIEQDRKLLPHNIIADLVYDSFSGNRTAVGVLLSLMPQDSLLNFLLPQSTEGIICVFTDTCGHVFTYQVNGNQATFLGYDDFHDPSYDRFKRSARLDFYKTSHDGLCGHDIHVYPSSTLEEEYSTNKPALYTSIVACSFLLMAILIMVYDFTVTRRQEKTMRSALRSGELIASLFPENVRDRLLNDINNKTDTKKGATKDIDGMKSSDDSVCPSRPIAEFFAGTTVMCKFLPSESISMIGFFVSDAMFSLYCSCRHIRLHRLVIYPR